MKRIEFIEPVAAMRGNMSGNQVLTYPTNDNSAWDAPDNRRNYAKHYTPRYIGAKKASNGLKYFAVKTRTATFLSPKARRAMAVFGGTGAIYANIINNAGQLYSDCLAYYNKTLEFGNKKTFRNTICDIIRDMLQNRKTTGYRIVSGVSVSIDNPWLQASTAGSPLNVDVPRAILTKFALQLGPVGLAEFKLQYGDSDYTFYNIAGKTWTENRNNTDGLLNNLNLSAIFVADGSTTVGTFSVAASPVTAMIQGGDLNGVPVYVIQDGAEVAVEPSDSVLLGQQFVAHA